MDTILSASNNFEIIDEKFSKNAVLQATSVKSDISYNNK